jgi:hypothetical protein
MPSHSGSSSGPTLLSLPSEVLVDIAARLPEWKDVAGGALSAARGMCYQDIITVSVLAAALWEAARHAW